jgi:hypothetical protein
MAAIGLSLWLGSLLAASGPLAWPGGSLSADGSGFESPGTQSVAAVAIDELAESDPSGLYVSALQHRPPLVMPETSTLVLMMTGLGLVLARRRSHRGRKH